MSQRLDVIDRFLTQHAALGTKHFLTLAVGLILAGCTTASVSVPTRIALLAPFEGRYREVGYNALYAARLAIADANITSVELSPIDDGGTAGSAVDRARALISDAQVKMALVIGYAATAPETLNAFGDLPVMVVGNWGVQPTNDRIFVLSNPEINALLTIPARTEVTVAARQDSPLAGGEILALEQLGKLRPSLQDTTIVTSAALPDPEFSERYARSDLFAPEPGLLASLTYDAINVALEALHVGGSRTTVEQTLANITYSGLNGEIAFENGYWRDAPIHTYEYSARGALLAVEGIVK